MADVFLAERLGDDGFKTRVALKRLHRGLAMDSYFIRQLIREARLLGQLEHANIVKVFDLRRIGDEYYVVMEYVDGIDLAAVVKVHRNRKTRIPRPFFFHVALSLSEALAYAHAAQDETGNATPLIHRDIKPSNVMLSRRGAVKLTDFGIAHVGDGSVTGGLVQGTANYMSPEQAFGEERLTPASDVYSLGAVFYEMLTGRPNVDGDNYLKAIHQVRERRVTLDELAGLGVEPGLRMVIAKMLSADMNGRYQEVESVRNDLQFVAERLKVDLSWHRIRAYVGRLMGILGRTADRATLSNLQVPEEIKEAAKHVIGPDPTPPPAPMPGTGTAPGPVTPPTPPPMERLKRNDSQPVTQAVQKDLIESMLAEGPGTEGPITPPTPSMPVAPLPPAAPVRHGIPPSYQGETVSVALRPGAKPGDDPLVGPPPMRPPVMGAAQGAIPTPPAHPVPLPPPTVSNPPGAPVAGPEGWDDNEATRVYTGKSPAEQGVMGTGQMGALSGPPSPATMPMPFGSQQLQPASALVDLAEHTIPPQGAETAPPSLHAPTIAPAGVSPGSGVGIPAVPASRPARPLPPSPPVPEDAGETDTEVWVFSEDDDGLGAPASLPSAAPSQRRAQGGGQRRRRKRRKSRPVSPLLLTVLVVMILFLLCAVLVAIAYKQDLIGLASTDAAGTFASSLFEIFPCPGADKA
ncbi:MAG: protein kinase [Proteobacteria bacterium]|nr:protein kinase [Pseudomonadota bacterium]